MPQTGVFQGTGGVRCAKDSVGKLAQHLQVQRKMMEEMVEIKNKYDKMLIEEEKKAR